MSGVKSKLAFTEAEREINANVAQCRQGACAVVVCEVNGLKAVNDTQGHKAGDEYIRNACSIICTHFKHSPVYRVGGDEFVVIMQGRDYQQRKELIGSFSAINAENLEGGDVVIACGMAEWNVVEDRALKRCLNGRTPPCTPTRRS